MNYAKKAQVLRKYADDEDNNILLRIGATGIAGAGMLGAMTIDTVNDIRCGIADLVSDGWNKLWGR